jgi:hypothetical protein
MMVDDERRDLPTAGNAPAMSQVSSLAGGAE